MKKCAIIGAGEITSYDFVKPFIEKCDFVISADGGYDHLKRMGIYPDLAVGDFDSITGKIIAPKVITLPKEKDDTDTIFAAKTAIQKGYNEIYLFGMLGGRLDHTIANIQLLLFLSENNIKAFIIDLNTILTVIKNQEISISPSDNYLFSVFSLTEKSEGVTIKNAKYELSDYNLKNNFPLGVSNEFIHSQNALIKVILGALLIVINKKWFFKCSLAIAL